MVKKVGRLAGLKTSGLIAITAATVGGFLSLSFNHNKPINVPAYKVIRVIDGDTFETEEHQYIRITAIDAPEKDMCGSQEATKELEKLILNQDIYLKVIYHDSTRLISIVYTKDGLIPEKMLASGWAELNDREGLRWPELTAASHEATTNKRGLYSELCTQTTNPKNPDCNIKGNIGWNNQKFYYFPGCNSYDLTFVQPHHGDQWFCTEADAKKADFVKNERCLDSYKKQ